MSYAITQAGAAVLRRYAFPLELQSDGYLLTLQQLGALRLFLLPRSVANQCQDNLQREGAWHTHTVRPPPTGPQQQRQQQRGSPPPPPSLNAAVAISLLLMVVVVVLCLLRRRGA